eukprot:1157498-Pelagomonas_calceolata.AAC.3
MFCAPGGGPHIACWHLLIQFFCLAHIAGVLHAAAPPHLHHQAAKAGLTPGSSLWGCCSTGVQALSAVWPEQPRIRELAGLRKGALGLLGMN